MANPIRLTNQVLVNPQLQVEDLEALNAVGIRAIVCNRPDNESDDQPSSKAIAEAAAKLNMSFAYLPLTPKLQARDGDAETFAKIINETQGEIVAYCKTGKRSVSLWALSQRDELSTDEIINTAAQSGFDISILEEQLDTAEVVQVTTAPEIVPQRKKGFFARIFGGS